MSRGFARVSRAARALECAGGDDRVDAPTEAPSLALVGAGGAIAIVPACVGDPDAVNFDQPWDDYTTEALVSACTPDAIRAGTPSSRRAIIDRGLDWVARRVMYSQTPQSREGGYRTDCSGLVSMAWGLPPPGNTTHSFAGGPWDNGRSRRITWNELEPGDALNNPANHIMLFAGWLDEAHTRFCTIEEYNWGRPASVIHHTIYDRSRGRNYRDAFIPIRFTNAPPGASVSAASATGGGTPSASATCYSQTLQRTVSAMTCLQSRFDGIWYQCVQGAWRAGNGTWGACSSSHPLNGNNDARCMSGTLGREVGEAVCVESRFDGLWYQCTDTGWVHNPSIGSTRRGPIGACATFHPLR